MKFQKMKHINSSWKLLSFLTVFLLQTAAGFAQFEIPPIPKFQTSVYDYANILEASEKAALEEKLVRYSDSTTTQIVVITIESLKGEDIGILTPKWGQTWGIGGSKENDNGVIMLLAEKERKIWISAGYGVEDRLSAGIIGEMTRNVIIPEFKAGSYYKGLDKGTDAIFEILKGKYKGERKKSGDSGESIFGGLLFFIILFVIIIVIISKNKNNRGGGSGRFNGPDLADIIILSSLGRNSGGGSFGGGGSSGGGFGGFGGGFGGGGFSGGGAGGSW